MRRCTSLLNPPSVKPTSLNSTNSHEFVNSESLINKQLMSRSRYHLTAHAQDETIPLRTGIIPKTSKVFLGEISIDEDGTAQQTKSNRDSGNYHILANVWLSEHGEERLPGRWRLVTVKPDDDYKDPPILTILPIDRLTARSEANLTDFLKKERRNNDKPWLTVQYIAQTLYPLLRDGLIRDHNDLSRHLNDVAMKPLVEAKNAAERGKAIAERDKTEAQLAKDAAERDRTQAENERYEALMKADRFNTIADEAVSYSEVLEKDKVILEDKVERLTAEGEQMKAAMAKISANKNGAEKQGAAQETSLEFAIAVTRPWPSKTGSDYMNIGVEATIIDVQRHGSNITLKYIDRAGKSQVVTDFGYYGFVDLVYNYLESCKNESRRAVFILTYKKSDMKMRLAADTMKLDAYIGLWRNK